MMVFDLTMPLSEGTPTFPGSPAPQFIPWENIPSDGYNLELLLLSSHSGTHLDAPSHFLDDGASIDQIPVDRLLVDATLINMEANGRRVITKRDITEYEATHGLIPDSSTIIFMTGWSRDPSKQSYFEKNPGISAPAAKYIASKGVNLVGIDSPSIDPGSSKKFPAHMILLKNNILILENLVNLDELDQPVFRLAVLPLRLKGATGSPVRAVAYYTK